MNVGSSFNGGGVAGFGYPIAEASEVQMTIAGGLGEVDRGGPSFNMIPKTGGNRFSGTGFLSTAGKWSQGNNLDDTLRSYGITEVPGLIKNWDTNFAIGGPIVRDRLWFFNNIRSYGQHADIPLPYANANAGNASQLVLHAERPASSRACATDKMIEAIRLTGQLTPKNKVGFYYDYQKNCTGSNLVAGRRAVPRPRGRLGGARRHRRVRLRVARVRQRLGRPREDRRRRRGRRRSRASCCSRPGCRRSTAAGAARSRPARRPADSGHRAQPGGGRADRQLHLSRVELGAAQRPAAQRVARVGDLRDRRAQHEGRLPGGLSDLSTSPERGQHAELHVQQHAVPSSFALRIAPAANSNRTRYDAFYVQDQWTRNRLTLQGGIRYEHAWSWVPGRRERRAGAVAIPGDAVHVPGDRRRDRLPRHHAAHGPRLRRVRQRQDVAEGERQQVPAAGEQRGRLHGHQSGRHVSRRRRAGPGPTRTTTSRPIAARRA